MFQWKMIAIELELATSYITSTMYSQSLNLVLGQFSGLVRESNFHRALQPAGSMLSTTYSAKRFSTSVTKASGKKEKKSHQN